MDDIKKISKSQINECILYFFIYSFIGWLMETIYSYILLGYFDNRGFLIGPICPIYGFGMLILTIGLSRYKNNNVKLFIMSAIILSVFEYITGYALDAIFQLKWWDYTNDFLNINGRICLFYALAWGMIAIIVVKCIHPFVSRITTYLIKKLPNLLDNAFIKLLVIILFIDIFLSSLQYWGIPKEQSASALFVLADLSFRI